jgi:hypothetical protein
VGCGDVVALTVLRERTPKSTARHLRIPPTGVAGSSRSRPTKYGGSGIEFQPPSRPPSRSLSPPPEPPPPAAERLPQRPSSVADRAGWAVTGRPAPGHRLREPSRRDLRPGVAEQATERPHLSEQHGVHGDRNPGDAAGQHRGHHDAGDHLADLRYLQVPASSRSGRGTHGSRESSLSAWSASSPRLATSQSQDWSPSRLGDI